MGVAGKEGTEASGSLIHLDTGERVRWGALGACTRLVEQEGGESDREGGRGPA